MSAARRRCREGCSQERPATFHLGKRDEQLDWKGSNMCPVLIAISEKLWQLIGAASHEGCRCEKRVMSLLEERIAADAELASALKTLTASEEEEIATLLWREIAATRAPRS